MTALPENLPLNETPNWQPDLASGSCPACKRQFLISQEMAGAPCPICAQAGLALQPVRMRSEEPELYIANQVSPEQATRIFGEFCAGVPFRTADLEPQNLLARSQLLFWPCWLLDADLEGSWAAEMGFDYQVKTAKEHLGGGSWQSQEHLRTQTRWEERRGAISRHYDNKLVVATAGHEQRTQRLGNYDLRGAHRFDPAKAQRMLVQLPDLQPDAVADLGKAALSKSAGADCMLASGAQHRRGFVFTGAFENQNWTQILLPMLSTWYRTDEGQMVPVTLNGQSGRIAGMRLASMRKARKLAAWILVILLLIGLAAAWALGALASAYELTNILLPLICLGLPLVLGLAAVPLLWAGRWNAAQKRQNEPLE